MFGEKILGASTFLSARVSDMSETPMPRGTGGTPVSLKKAEAPPDRLSSLRNCLA